MDSVLGFEIGLPDGYVPAGHREVGMSKHLLQGKTIHAATDCPDRGSVTECVRTASNPGYTSPLPQPSDQLQ